MIDAGIEEQRAVDLEFREKLKKRLGQVAAVGLGVVGVSALAEGGLLGVGNPIARTTQTVPAVPGATTAQSTNPQYTISCWGDSQTIIWPQQLATVSGVPVNTEGWSGATSTNILAAFATAEYWWNNTTVIWSGNNDSLGSTVEANVATMVSDLTSVGNANYLVMGVVIPCMATDFSGQAGYILKTGINTSLASTYGSKYLDIHSYLLSLYNPGLPLDVIDFNNGVDPNSLRRVLKSGTLGSAISSTNTQTFSLTYTLGTPAAGDIIGVDGERIQLVTVDGSGNVTACNRGYLNTTQATHTSGTAWAYTDQLHFSIATYNLIATKVWTTLKTLYPSTFGTSGTTGSATAVTPNGLIVALQSPPPIGSTNPGTAVFTDLTVLGFNNNNPNSTVIWPVDGEGYYEPWGTAKVFYNNWGGGFYCGTACGNVNIQNGTIEAFGCTAIGWFCLNQAQSGITFETAVGYNALAADQTGTANVAIGYETLQFLTNGTANTAVGTGAMANAGTGVNYNIAIGNNAGNGIGGTANIGIGFQTLYTSNTGSWSVAIGYEALNQFSGSTGEQVAIGTGAGQNLTTGNSNVLIGMHAGQNGQTYSTCTLIGHNVACTDAITNAIAIGSGVTVTASNTCIIGNSSLTSVGTGGYAAFTPGNAGLNTTPANIWSGTGAPATSLGSQGDFYFRVDGSSGTHLYFKSGSSTWTGIV